MQMGANSLRTQPVYQLDQRNFRNSQTKYFSSGITQTTKAPAHRSAGKNIVKAQKSHNVYPDFLRQDSCESMAIYRMALLCRLRSREYALRYDPSCFPPPFG